MNASLECHHSGFKMFAILLGCCLFVAVGCFLTMSNDKERQLVGWISVAFGGLCVLAILLTTLRTGPVVIVNGDGIDDRRLGCGVIRWDEIAELSSLDISSAHFLMIEVHEPEDVFAHMHCWKRWGMRINNAVGFRGIYVGFNGLTPGRDEVLAFIFNNDLLPELPADDEDF